MLLRNGASVVIATCAALGSACVGPPPGELTNGFPKTLPANGKLMMPARPPIDLTFERIDGGVTRVLEQDVIGGGSSRDEPVFLVDVGDISVGDTITVAARCGGECNEVADILIVDEDTSPPTVGDGAVRLTARGRRASPFDPLVSAYDVTPTFPAINDRGGPDDEDDVEENGDPDFDPNIGNGFGDVFTHYRGAELQVIRHFTDSFFVDGGGARPLCVTVTLIDRGGNETTLPDQVCVDLDPSTAPPWEHCRSRRGDDLEAMEGAAGLKPAKATFAEWCFVRFSFTPVMVMCDVLVDDVHWQAGQDSTLRVLLAQRQVWSLVPSTSRLPAFETRQRRQR